MVCFHFVTARYIGTVSTFVNLCHNVHWCCNTHWFWLFSTHFKIWLRLISVLWFPLSLVWIVEEHISLATWMQPAVHRALAHTFYTEASNFSFVYVWRVIQLITSKSFQQLRTYFNNFGLCKKMLFECSFCIKIICSVRWRRQD